MIAIIFGYIESGDHPFVSWLVVNDFLFVLILTIARVVVATALLPETDRR